MNPEITPSLFRCGLVAACVALAATNASAAPTENQTPQQTTSSYTDRGTTNSTVTTTVDTSYRDYTPAYVGMNHNYGGGIHTGFHSFSAQITIQRRPIYLPPIPPALGEKSSSQRSSTSLNGVALPSMLGNCIYESFYAPLSTLLYIENLDRRRRERLDAFRASRTALLVELRAKLDEQQLSDPEKRAAALRAFATAQAPRLLAQESSAEEIRSNLVNGSWLQAGVDWNDNREWRLGDNTRWESSNDELKVVLGASFFQEGLSSPQRYLLRELAMELADSARAPDADISLDAPGPYLYFSPFTARIRLPADLPSELAARIEEYTARKTALKQALRDELYKQDRAFFSSTRVNALKALAAKQEAEFATLEQLAEEIRVGLLPLPNPARPPALPLPPALTNRIGTYLERKAEWQREMVTRVEELRAALPDDRVEFDRVGGAVGIKVVPHRKAKEDAKAKREQQLATLEPFNVAHRKTYLELAREKERIQQEVLNAASASAGVKTTKSIDKLLYEFSYALGQHETWLRYADYETAVLQPGLSPEQRRLLFGAALEKLDLPLLNR